MRPRPFRLIDPDSSDEGQPDPKQSRHAMSTRSESRKSRERKSLEGAQAPALPPVSSLEFAEMTELIEQPVAFTEPPAEPVAVVHADEPFLPFVQLQRFAENPASPNQQPHSKSQIM